MRLKVRASELTSSPPPSTARTSVRPCPSAVAASSSARSRLCVGRKIGERGDGGAHAEQAEREPGERRPDLPDRDERRGASAGTSTEPTSAPLTVIGALSERRGPPRPSSSGGRSPRPPAQSGGRSARRPGRPAASGAAAALAGGAAALIGAGMKSGGRPGSPPRPASPNRRRRPRGIDGAYETGRQSVAAVRAEAAVVEHDEERLVDVAELAAQIGVELQPGFVGQRRAHFRRNRGAPAAAATSRTAPTIRSVSQRNTRICAASTTASRAMNPTRSASRDSGTRQVRHRRTCSRCPRPSG